MAFDGSEGGVIDLQTAAAWTANYRNTGATVHAQFFGRDIVNQILDQDGCMGIRIYYAQDDTGVAKLILVGAGVDEEDLFNGAIADLGTACPPKCGASSPLSANI